MTAYANRESPTKALAMLIKHKRHVPQFEAAKMHLIRRGVNLKSKLCDVLRVWSGY